MRLSKLLFSCSNLSISFWVSLFSTSIWSSISRYFWNTSYRGTEKFFKDICMTEVLYSPNSSQQLSCNLMVGFLRNKEELSLLASITLQWWLLSWLATLGNPVMSPYAQGKEAGTITWINSVEKRLGREEEMLIIRHKAQKCWVAVRASLSRSFFLIWGWLSPLPIGLSWGPYLQ